MQLLLFVLRKYLPGGARQADRQTERYADKQTALRRRWLKQNGLFHTWRPAQLITILMSFLMAATTSELPSGETLQQTSEPLLFPLPPWWPFAQSFSFVVSLVAFQDSLYPASPSFICLFIYSSPPADFQPTLQCSCDWRATHQHMPLSQKWTLCIKARHMQVFKDTFNEISLPLDPTGIF